MLFFLLSQFMSLRFVAHYKMVLRRPKHLPFSELNTQAASSTSCLEKVVNAAFPHSVVLGGAGMLIICIRTSINKL